MSSSSKVPQPAANPAGDAANTPREARALGMVASVLLGFGPAAALGVGRFSYALVLPSMQEALQLSYGQVGWLGSANTAGYLLGALFSHHLLYAIGYRRGFFAALLLQTLSVAGLAFTDSFSLLFVLRFSQGALGALVFIGGAALLLASGGRARASACYFGGVGLGIMASPLVLATGADWQGLWLYLALIALLLSIAPLGLWSRLQEPAPRNRSSQGSLRPIRLLLLSYGFFGAGYIGYMTFVTSELPVSLPWFWLVLGIGALLTGVVWGYWIERVGGDRAMLHILLVLCCASSYPLLYYAPWLSGFAFGLSFLGVISAITQVFSSLLPPGAWARAMGVSTAVFSLGQALGPSVSGFAADSFGGAEAALGVSTLLLALALLAAWWSLQRIGQREALS